MRGIATESRGADRKPVNVLFMNDHLGFSDGAIHGPARYFYNILNCFDSSNVNPSLCILRDWHPFALELENKGIRPIFLSRSKWNPLALTDLIFLVRKLNIDILHVAGMKGCLIGRLVSRLTGIPVVIHFRDMNPPGLIARYLLRCLSGQTEIFVAVSDPVRSFAKKEFAIASECIEVLHNPISLNFFNSVNDDGDKIRAEFGILPTAKVIGIIGRLSPEKGHLSLIRILPNLICKYPATVLLIVGDGPIRDECKLLVQKLKLEQVVRFAGHRNDIPAIFAAVDIVAMPSAREGFPNTALEAIAAGKPVVGFNVGGLPEIVIEGKTGFLSPSGDIGSLTKTLIRILANGISENDWRKECLIHANKFTIEKHIKRLEGIYRNLMLRKMA